MGISHGIDYRMGSTGVFVSKFMAPDHVLSLKAADTADPEDDAEAQTIFALQYKYFAGNSFYISPEIYYMNYDENGASDTGNLNIFDNKNEKKTTLGLGFRIGNQWQWSHFTLGVDWIGYGRNVVHWQRTNDDLDLHSTFTFMNMYVGWSF